MNTRSGCVHFTRAISCGQNSSAGGSSPHVRAKTSLVISIAMSQRSPSHCAADVDQHVGDRAAQPGVERVELHHVRPRREVRVAAAGDAVDPVLVGDEELGVRLHPRVVGRDVVGHVVEDQPEPRGRPVARARARGRCGRRSARRPRSAARSRASRSRRPGRRSGSATRKLSASAGSARAISSPAGERSHTPISHTASTPSAARPSHARAGTCASVCTPRCDSHTAVLIS